MFQQKIRRLKKEKLCMVFGTVLLCVTVVTYFTISAQTNFNRMERVLLTPNYDSNKYNELENDKLDPEMTTVTSLGPNIERTTTKTNRVTTKEDKVEARFQRRKKMMSDACTMYSKRLKTPLKCEVENAGFNLKYINESQLVYCAIEKAGSTFWKRILHVIGGWANDSNPVSIKSEDADTKHGGFETLKNSTLDEMHEVFDTSKRFMFVRDPYTRLFSAWLDKFYSPNPYYWKSFGPSIARSEREITKNVTGKCIPDISFTEFIGYTVKIMTTDLCVDGHFAPNYQHCLPCVLPYDYIGKYETFKEDTLHLLNKFNLSNIVRFDDFESDAALDAIRDSTEWVFSQRENIKNCSVTFGCALFKLWNRLQSRGIISKTIAFPFNNANDIVNITKDEFTSALKNAYKQSDKDEVKNNRDEALHLAYRTLPKKLKSKIMSMFHIDFKMFGYDRSPWYMDEEDVKAYNYFEQCPKLEG